MTVWTVSSAAQLTHWGELYQLSMMAQLRRQTQSHRLFKTVNQEQHTDYHHLNHDQFSATVISYINSIQFYIKQYILKDMELI